MPAYEFMELSSVFHWETKPYDHRKEKPGQDKPLGLCVKVFILLKLGSPSLRHQRNRCGKSEFPGIWSKASLHQAGMNVTYYGGPGFSPGGTSPSSLPRRLGLERLLPCGRFSFYGRLCVPMWVLWRQIIFFLWAKNSFSVTYPSAPAEADEMSCRVYRCFR